MLLGLWGWRISAVYLASPPTEVVPSAPARWSRLSKWCCSSGATTPSPDLRTPSASPLAAWRPQVQRAIHRRSAQHRRPAPLPVSPFCTAPVFSGLCLSCWAELRRCSREREMRSPLRWLLRWQARRGGQTDGSGVQAEKVKGGSEDPSPLESTRPHHYLRKRVRALNT